MLGQIGISSYRCPLHYLSLFDEHQVKGYLRKRFGNFFQKRIYKIPCKKEQEANTATKCMDSLQFRPFLLAHIEDVMQAVRNGDNEFYIYQSLVETWLNREVNRLRKKKIEVSAQDLLQVCIWIAEYLTDNDTNTISIEKIGSFVHAPSAIELLVSHRENIIKGISKLDISSNSLLNKNSDGEFRFSHLTIREFLFSLGLKGGKLKTRERKRKVSKKNT